MSDPTWLGESMPPEPKPVRHQPVGELRSLATLGTVASMLIVLTAISGAAIALVSWRVRSVVHEYIDPASAVTEADLDSVDGLSRLSGILYLVVILLGAAVFITWLWKARVNSEMLSYGQHRRSRGWAIGSWFVPIVCWWFPYQVVSDVWKASNPETRIVEGELSRASGSPLLILWWLSWLGASIAGYVSFRFGMTEPMTPDHALRLIDQIAIADTVSSVFEVIAAGLVIKIIGQVGTWQKAASTPETATVR